MTSRASAIDTSPPPRAGWQPVAPSPQPYDGLPVPHELSVEEIQQLVHDFAASTERALAAGFAVAEVHGAHGYLLHSFLSLASNHRIDAYGGSLENRLRFPLQVVDAVRGVWPDDMPVFLRTSATDWLSEHPRSGRQGWTGQDTVGPGYRLGFAHQVRAATGSTHRRRRSDHRPAERRGRRQQRTSRRSPAWPRTAPRPPLARTRRAPARHQPRWPYQYRYVLQRRH